MCPAHRGPTGPSPQRPCDPRSRQLCGGTSCDSITSRHGPRGSPQPSLWAKVASPWGADWRLEKGGQRGDEGLEARRRLSPGAGDGPTLLRPGDLSRARAWWPCLLARTREVRVHRCLARGVDTRGAVRGLSLRHPTVSRPGPRSLLTAGTREQEGSGYRTQERSEGRGHCRRWGRVRGQPQPKPSLRAAGPQTRFLSPSWGPDIRGQGVTRRSLPPLLAPRGSRRRPCLPLTTSFAQCLRPKVPSYKDTGVGLGPLCPL